MNIKHNKNIYIDLKFTRLVYKFTVENRAKIYENSIKIQLSHEKKITRKRKSDDDRENEDDGRKRRKVKVGSC